MVRAWKLYEYWERLEEAFWEHDELLPYPQLDSGATFYWRVLGRRYEL